MKNLVLAVFSLMMILSIKGQAQIPPASDSVNCKLAENHSMAAIYDFKSKKLKVSITAEGATQIVDGEGYETFTKEQLAKDDTLMGLAKFAHIKVQDVHSAAAFIMANSQTDGLAAIVKYLDVKGQQLGVAGIFGMTPVVCK